jgi:hypothetical protein
METHTRVQAQNSSSVQLTTSSPGVKYVLIAWGPASSTLQNDFHQFNGPFLGTEDAPFLTSLQVNFGNKSYPSPQYNFINQLDVARAYMDYRVFSLANSTSTGSVMTLRTWMESPVFIFHVEGEPGSQSNILSVNTSSTFPNTYNIYITVLYEKELSITYDGNGMVATTTTASLV